jgi:hypothetical protein
MFIMDLYMSIPPAATDRRHTEAERLIEIARDLLDRPEEEIVVNYLDHAVEALHIITQNSRPASA